MRWPNAFCRHKHRKKRLKNTMSLDRRNMICNGLIFSALSLSAFTRPAWAAADKAVAELQALEKQAGGRLGIAVRDIEGKKHLTYRATERFAFCSTFKFLLSAQILSRVARGEETLDRKVSYTQNDIVTYSPVTGQHLTDGGMTIADLCIAAMQVSDNTAANLLLKSVGGPSALTAYARTLGDRDFRLDRMEPDLNSAIVNDPHDTTTPSAMAEDVYQLLYGTHLPETQRQQLRQWLESVTTGTRRIKAGLQTDWKIADKTGSGSNGTYNDIGLITRPTGTPLVVAAYYTGATGTAAEAETVLATAGSIIARFFAK